MPFPEDGVDEVVEGRCRRHSFDDVGPVVGESAADSRRGVRVQVTMMTDVEPADQECLGRSLDRCRCRTSASVEESLICSEAAAPREPPKFWVRQDRLTEIVAVLHDADTRPAVAARVVRVSASMGRRNDSYHAGRRHHAARPEPHRPLVQPTLPPWLHHVPCCWNSGRDQRQFIGVDGHASSRGVQRAIMARVRTYRPRRQQRSDSARPFPTTAQRSWRSG